MGTYKGNKGNLMQHWTLCEALRIAQKQGVEQISFIDAHAMAPLANGRTTYDKGFHNAQTSLPGQKSTYELAWQVLAPSPSHDYPNSANFVTQVWRGKYSLLLCEQDSPTAGEVKAWLSDVRRWPQCKHAELCEGDWRVRFEKGLPSPEDIGLEKEALTFLSFDPYMISKGEGGFKMGSGSMYPQDLDTIGEALRDCSGGLLMQLSTYTANGGNCQEDVAPLVDQHLGRYGFVRVAKVRVNGHMMSLIYTRNVAWAHELKPLGERFSAWL